ncbi:hypothetical protein [Nesterenkonia marinintestina]|uniref:hypothetical protein n=1 Tax=Nesterenkonia marinintestina TaxID=2979865 RepID=UPI0021BFBD9F|nr:hypothetical protein [Nesterenkonia sp. GX14115]
MGASTSRSPRLTWAAAWSGVLIGALLVAAAIIVPRVTPIDVAIGTGDFDDWKPLKAAWEPELTPTLLLPVAVGLLGFVLWPRLSRSSTWPQFLALTFVGSWLWTAALGHVGGAQAIRKVFDRDSEYFVGAKEVTSIPQFMTEFVDRIPKHVDDNWPIHIAGHPPGATLFFIMMNRMGVEDPYTAGMIVMTLGCTAAVGVVLTVRTLASERMARRTAPWVVAAPSAIWMGVSGDALFTAVAAWGLALLALSATAERRSRLVGFGLGSGLLLGLCVYLSYGLVLLGVLALAVLVLGRRWAALPWALGGALLVAAAFTLAGFRWWEAFPVLVTRYYDGIQSDRPYGYWVWANLGVWTFSAGLAVWAAFGRGIAEVRRRAAPERFAPAVLGWAGFAAILLATLSSMSQAEIERIWLPFTIWVLILPTLLPAHWHRPLIATQMGTAILIELLWTTQW